MSFETIRITYFSYAKSIVGHSFGKVKLKNMTNKAHQATRGTITEIYVSETVTAEI